MSPVLFTLIVAFVIVAAFTRRRRRSSRYREHDAEAIARDLASGNEKDDIVSRQPPPFIADDGPYIGGARGYGRGGFGGHWDGLPNPDAASSRQEDDGSKRFPSAR